MFPLTGAGTSTAWRARATTDWSLEVEPVIINLDGVVHREARGDWFTLDIEARQAAIVLVGLDDVKLSRIELRLGPSIRKGWSMRRCHRYQVGEAGIRSSVS